VSADASQVDSDRFSAMFEAHAAHVFDYCRSLLADRLDAADAAQATLVTAYSLLDRLQDVGRQRAWLFALARRECVGEHPVRTRLPNSARDPAAVVRAREPNADDEPETEELRIGIIEGHGQAGATLRALPAPEREVLDLVYRHYLSSADVGAVLGVPAERASALLAGAVKSFERAYDGTKQVGQPEDATGALVTGVRVISTIPLQGCRRRSGRVPQVSCSIPSWRPSANRWPPALATWVPMAFHHSRRRRPCGKRRAEGRARDSCCSAGCCSWRRRLLP
jgi:RNA polymerase sigma factor (sigma-70 family)